MLMFADAHVHAHRHQRFTSDAFLYYSYFLRKLSVLNPAQLIGHQVSGISYFYLPALELQTNATIGGGGRDLNSVSILVW